MIILELDRPRELRFGFKALKLAKALLEKSIIEVMNEMQTNKQGFFDNDIFEKLLYCGLKADDDELKLESIEDILDKMSYAELNSKLVEAIFEAYGMGYGAGKVDKVPVEEAENKEDNKKK